MLSWFLHSTKSALQVHSMLSFSDAECSKWETVSQGAVSKIDYFTDTCEFKSELLNSLVESSVTVSRYK